MMVMEAVQGNASYDLAPDSVGVRGGRTHSVPGEDNGLWLMIHQVLEEDQQGMAWVSRGRRLMKADTNQGT